jgi:Skp family chaperone for outer membrane proteins
MKLRFEALCEAPALFATSLCASFAASFSASFSAVFSLSRRAVVAATVCVLCVLCAFAGSVQEARAQKIGYVATQAIRDRFYEYKTAQQRIEEIAAGWKRSADDMQTAITNLEQEIQRKRLVLGDAERREKDSTLGMKRYEREEFIRKKFGAGGEFDTVATNYLRPVEAKISAAVQDVSATDGFDMVFDKATTPLMVASPRYDLTVKVLEKLGVFAEDLKVKQKEAIDREDKLKQEQRGKTTPSRRRGPPKDPAASTTPAPTAPASATNEKK